MQFSLKNIINNLGKDTPSCEKTFHAKNIDLLQKTVVNCPNFRKLKLKCELKWNFDILKLDICNWKKNQVTLDISKNQDKSTGGLCITDLFQNKICPKKNWFFPRKKYFPKKNYLFSMQLFSADATMF